MSEEDHDEDNKAGTPVRRRTGGRSARVREAVLKATLEIFLERGLNGLTFLEIGRRAGVHATSVQRQWGSRENVLFDAIQGYVAEDITVPDTGSLRKDLILFNRSLRDCLSTPFGGMILYLLVTAGEDDYALIDNCAELMRVRAASVRMMISRAKERGELRPDVDDDIALELALGPLYGRTLITRQTTDNDHIERVIDLLFRGLGNKS